MKNHILIFLLTIMMIVFCNCKNQNVPVLNIKHIELVSILEHIASYEKGNKEANQEAPNLCATVEIVKEDTDILIIVSFVRSHIILFDLSNLLGFPIGVATIGGYDFFYYDTNNLKTSSFVEYAGEQKSYLFPEEEQTPIIEEFDTWIFEIKGDSIILKESYL